MEILLLKKTLVSTCPMLHLEEMPSPNRQKIGQRGLMLLFCSRKTHSSTLETFWQKLQSLSLTRELHWVNLVIINKPESSWCVIPLQYHVFPALEMLSENCLAAWEFKEPSLGQLNCNGNWTARDQKNVLVPSLKTELAFTLPYLSSTTSILLLRPPCFSFDMVFIWVFSSPSYTILSSKMKSSVSHIDYYNII